MKYGTKKINQQYPSKNIRKNEIATKRIFCYSIYSWTNGNKGLMDWRRT